MADKNEQEVSVRLYQTRENKDSQPLWRSCSFHCVLFHFRNYDRIQIYFDRQSCTLFLYLGVAACRGCWITLLPLTILHESYFSQGKRPVTVGMWFSLGHSTIVIGITVGLAVAAKEIVGLVPGFESGGNIWGTGLSGLFLFHHRTT